MQRKKGISLIVLVITIIVMIILATTIILAINNNNVVDKAKDAVTETNYNQVQELAQTLWADVYIEGARTQEELETAVIEGLKGTDTSEYTITVTTIGVEVSVKAEVPVEPEEPTEPEGAGDAEDSADTDGSGNTEVSTYDSVFANNEWTEIIAAVQNDEVPSTWAVGDTKSMTIGGTEYNIQIIGKDHDVYSDGSGTAPLTFQIVEIYTLAHIHGESLSSNKNGWSDSDLRTGLLFIQFALPSEVNSALKAVNKITIQGGGKNASSPTTLETTSDKLFLLSETEVYGTTKHSGGVAEGTQYLYYSNVSTMEKTLKDGTEASWWLRGPAYYDSGSYSFVPGGAATSRWVSAMYSANDSGVSFAFCF